MKKTEIEKVPAVLNDTIDGIPDASEVAEQLELRAFVTGLGVGVNKISIFKLEPGRGSGIWVGSTDPGTITEEYLQKRYGGGKFRLRFLDERGVFKAHKTIDIAELSHTESFSGGTASPIIPTLPAASSIDMTQLLMTQINSKDQIILSMIAAMAEKNNGNGVNIPELLRSMNEMRPKEVDPFRGLEALSGLFKSAFDTALGAKESSEKNSNWVDLIRDGIQMIPKILPAITQNSASAHISPNNGNPEVRALPEIPDTKKMLYDAIQWLKVKAVAGSDVGLYIDYLLDSADEPQVRGFIEMTKQPYEFFGNIDPELLTDKFKPWFFELYKGVRDATLGNVNAGVQGDVADVKADE